MDDMFITPQRVNAGATIIEPEAVANLVTSVIESGEDPEAIKLWWHSHAKGGVFFSHTDDETMRILTQNFMFGLVGNHAGHVRARFDMADPFPITIDEIPVSYLTLSDEVTAWCQREISRNVKPISVARVRSRRGKQFPPMNDERVAAVLEAAGS